MQNPIITNKSLGLKIELGYTIIAAEIVTIDLTPGAKLVTNNSGDNLIGTLTADSDLGTFRLEVDPTVVDGINDMEISAAGATAASLIKFKYFHRYVGL
ncbi:hypothetical protein ES705_07278 [subsurface metagenome]